MSTLAATRNYAHMVVDTRGPLLVVVFVLILGKSVWNLLLVNCGYLIDSNL